jgi:hypothetical protein
VSFVGSIFFTESDDYKEFEPIKEDNRIVELDKELVDKNKKR